MSGLPITDTLHEHMRLTAEHKDLMRQVAELRDGKKFAAAQKLMKRTEAVYAQIQKLEQASKPRGP